MSYARTVTTGHMANGMSVFIKNPKFEFFDPAIAMIYSTNNGDPIDLNRNADIAACESGDPYDQVPTRGSVVLAMEWPPGASTDGLRSVTVDVGVMVAGRVMCLLDSDQRVVVEPGDVLILRGTLHAWKNPSETEAARMICFRLPCQPVQGANVKPWKPNFPGPS